MCIASAAPVTLCLHWLQRVFTQPALPFLLQMTTLSPASKKSSARARPTPVSSWKGTVADARSVLPRCHQPSSLQGARVLSSHTFCGTCDQDIVGRGHDCFAACCCLRCCLHADGAHPPRGAGVCCCYSPAVVAGAGLHGLEGGLHAFVVCRIEQEQERTEMWEDRLADQRQKQQEQTKHREE